ncbi:anthranilate synthase component 2/putative glutamine amidotransferase [Brevibacterium sanguinis]|uniref:Anthranilate synthase component 2/putative glutamine amidotransferase n=2 Tax=Brevibacterium TaxID=1696 RepID=A0A366IHN7_9MICO|nr:MULTISPECIES: gamma-glutamyl-gamma-aminobutyrate hydrolase family protein [Brevibacterium]RBP65100.1 anthranilate synthase component 2/putative glutamine amidotransferase [Brevibacterium sanguinis]RBP71363.1 anthranilate synthase component 2/putative glutamine amidotransferase [Brevibacterium celere]
MASNDSETAGTPVATRGRTRPAGGSRQPAATGAPVIAISCYQQQAAWGVWDAEAALIPADYVRMVSACGGIPVLLPPHGQAPAVLDRVDGLILAGGADVDPGAYDSPAHPSTVSQPYRDASELMLLEAARDRRLPVLGICRGMQVINVFAGGTLHQHLPEAIGHSDYQPAPGVYGEVEVSTVPGTLAEAVLGPRLTAPCYHHQGIERLGAELRASGHNREGLIEILEPETVEDWWMLGVQWHPEHHAEDERVVQALVTAARGFRPDTPARRGRPDTAGSSHPDTPARNTPPHE